MKKLLFLINNLTAGGAERVLVNLVNQMDAKKYDITVMTISDLGINREYLASHIHYHPLFSKRVKGLRHLFMLLGNRAAFKMMPIREHYDVMIAFLQGLPTRIIAGCPDPNVKKIAWIHSDVEKGSMVKYYRNDQDLIRCYQAFNAIVGVSTSITKTFAQKYGLENRLHTCHNTNDVLSILEKAALPVPKDSFSEEGLKVISTGRLTPEKGFSRLIQAHRQLLTEGVRHTLYLLGDGPEMGKLQQQIQSLHVADSVKLMGFQENPYRYLSKCNLFVCSSYYEGYSTALSEAIILGLPCLSTRCSGADEILGENSEYGLLVPNDDEALYAGMKKLLTNRALLDAYAEKSRERSRIFSPQATVKEVETLIDSLT